MLKILVLKKFEKQTRLAHSIAVANPIPELPPVISTTLSVNLWILFLSKIGGNQKVDQVMVEHKIIKILAKK